MCGSVSENSQARLAVPVKAERAFEQIAGEPFVVGDFGGRRLAVVSSSIGLGSNRSTWLGPPCMKSWMTALARGVKCGGFSVKSCCRPSRRPLPGSGFPQQRCQRQPTKAASHAR